MRERTHERGFFFKHGTKILKNIIKIKQENKKRRISYWNWYNCVGFKGSYASCQCLNANDRADSVDGVWSQREGERERDNCWTNSDSTWCLSLFVVSSCFRLLAIVLCVLFVKQTKKNLSCEKYALARSLGLFWPFMMELYSTKEPFGSRQQKI